MKMKMSAHSLLLAVYVSVSIATFQHTAWGFGTLAGEYPVAMSAVIWWWIMGGLMAGAVDVGMGVIVWLKMQAGEHNPAHFWTLAFLAVFSAYAQVLFASHHAAAYALGEVPVWLEWLQVVLDARTLVLPLALPGLALISGFVAKQQVSSKPVTFAQMSDKTPVSASPSTTAKATDKPATDTLAVANDTRKTKADDRRARILSRLNSGVTDPDKLAELEGVTVRTIRRDIRALNGQVQQQ